MLTGQLILIFQAFLQSNHRKSAQLPMVQQTSSKLPSCRCCVYPPFVDDFPRIKNMAFWHLCKRFKQNPTFVHFRVPAVLGEQGFWKGLHLLQSCCPAEIQGPLKRDSTNLQCVNHTEMILRWLSSQDFNRFNLPAPLHATVYKRWSEMKPGWWWLRRREAMGKEEKTTRTSGWW